jgi:hypothetical protein
MSGLEQTYSVAQALRGRRWVQDITGGLTVRFWL